MPMYNKIVITLTNGSQIVTPLGNRYQHFDEDDASRAITDMWKELHDNVPIMTANGNLISIPEKFVLCLTAEQPSPREMATDY